MRYPVRETFALNALEGCRRTFPVLHLAGVPFEIPFGQIAMQMRLADRMVRAVNSALHEAETRFRSVDVQKMAKPHVLVRTVVDGAMA